MGLFSSTDWSIIWSGVANCLEDNQLQQAIGERVLGDRIVKSMRPLIKLISGPSGIKQLLDEDAKTINGLMFNFVGISDQIVADLSFRITKEWLEALARRESVEIKKVDSLDQFSEKIAPKILQSVMTDEVTTLPEFYASVTPIKSIVKIRVFLEGETDTYKRNAVVLQLHAGYSTVLTPYFGHESTILNAEICHSPYDLYREVLQYTLQ